MRTNLSPRELAVDLLPRSTCSVQVASVITDSTGKIIAWGWNHMGPTGYGMCAERHAISRGNKDRYAGGTIYVAGRYQRNNRSVNAIPCEICTPHILSYNLKVVYRDKEGKWI